VGESPANLLNLTVLIMQLVLTAALYTVIHEGLHYIASRLVGCRAVFRLNNYILVSPSIHVTCDGEVSAVSRVAILYSPYIANMLLLLFSPWHIARLMALFTLPNALLESQRSPSRLALAVMAAAVIILAVAASEPPAGY